MIAAMANHLLQSTLFALAAGLVALALRKNHARSRHGVWLAVSVKFLVPFALLSEIGSRIGMSLLPATPTPAHPATIAPMFFPFPAPGGGNAALPVPTSSHALTTILWIAWAVGCAAVILPWCVRWRRMARLVRSASPLPTHASGLPVRSCEWSVEPAVFGILHPVLLLPAGLAERLPADQLEAILAHELCHVRWRDNLAGVIHMVAQAIFWFYPLLWWLGGRLVEERERACDEEVLRQGSDPEVYAASILKACEVCLETPLPCISGVTGGGLAKRIERIMTGSLGTGLGLGKKLLMAAAGLVAVTAPLLIGLLNAPRSAAQTPETGPPPAFEVASVKPTTVSVNPGRFTAMDVSLKMLIQFAYGVKEFQISGGSAWIGNDHWEIEVKCDGTVTDSHRKLMVQTLLADRFQLKFHRENREISVYALAVGKNGPKLGPPKQEEKKRIFMQPAPQGLKLVGIRTTMQSLVGFLGMLLDRTVLDKTGLAGEYDFEAAWMPDETQAMGMRIVGTQTDRAGPSLAAALQESLGLKLESTKGPVEFLVIDYAEKASGN
ncbi:putative Antirepressor regulating drug resistance protein [Candidatus Sulfopaludibacter sp. SbA3]|nr:putative Antirepressor regulating drug resistance protein [Candidatus Sulfopaludibacter sp. SbA3]